MANREIDDVYHRLQSNDSYKNRVFDGKKSVSDDYTGERIFYGNRADAKKKHSLDKVADIDHVTPIAKIKERYKDLPVEQQRKLANNERYNYATTNATLNRSEKNALENHEYLAKKARGAVDSALSGDLGKARQEMKELTNQAPRMLSSEAKSRANMSIEAGGYRIDNAVKKAGIDASTLTETVSTAGMDFLDGATENVTNAAFPLMVLGVQNICEVATGQKTLEEAGKEMGEATAEVAVMGGGGRMIQKAVGEVAEKAGSDLLKNIAQNTNEIVQIASVGILVFKSFTKLVNNEISGTEFFEEIGEQGVSLVGDFLGTGAGMAIMGALGAGTFAVGAAGFIGGLVVSTVCVEIYRYTKSIRAEYLAKEKEYKSRIAMVNRIADQALVEMQYQQNCLKDMMKERDAEWTQKFSAGFDTVIEAMMNDDFDQLSDGLNHILSVFGETVKFSNMQEFDEFFFDDNAELNL